MPGKVSRIVSFRLHSLPDGLSRFPWGSPQRATSPSAFGLPILLLRCSISRLSVTG